MNGNPKAFVIMPFDTEFNSIYEDLIKPALEDSGYDVSRSDSFLNQQNIISDIIRGIATADLVVADLTTLNPNVLYELGLCHGLKVPTILLSQSTNEIPFDLRPYKFQIYSTRFDQVYKLKEALKEIGEKHILREIIFGSPVIDFLSSEGATSKLKNGGKLKEKPVEEALEEFEDEKGFLDFMVEASTSSEDIAKILSEITQETNNMTDKLKVNTARINALTKNPGPGTAAQTFRITSEVAKDIIEYSDKLEIILPIFEQSIDILTESSSRYAAWVQPKSEEERKSIIVLRDSIFMLSNVTKTSLESISEYRDSVSRLKGISRDINQATRRLIQALDGVISSMEKMQAFCSRTLAIIEEKI